MSVLLIAEVSSLDATAKALSAAKKLGQAIAPIRCASGRGG